MSRPISRMELLAYRAEFRNDLFRQIHRRLRELKATGFTQKRMAQRLGVDEGQLSRCLRGDTDLRLETLSDLARALGCRISASLQSLELPKTTQLTTVADYSDSEGEDQTVEAAVTGTDAGISIAA